MIYNIKLIFHINSRKKGVGLVKTGEGGRKKEREEVIFPSFKGKKEGVVYEWIVTIIFIWRDGMDGERNIQLFLLLWYINLYWYIGVGFYQSG